MDGTQARRTANRGDTNDGDRAVQTLPPVLHERDAGRDAAVRAIATQRRFCWRDAEQAAAPLTISERTTLETLLRVPLANVGLLGQLGGLQGGAAVYRRIVRLRAAGLVSEIRPPTQPGHGPGLLFVTDLGLAAVAVAHRLDPLDLALRFRVRGRDLLGRLPSLQVLLASYRLLGAVAFAGSGWPRLLLWEQPFRRRFRHHTARMPIAVELPACAVLAWNDDEAAFLLLPDLGTSHLRAYRPALYRLHRLRQVVGNLPRLVIAAPSRRGRAWRALLEDVAQARRDAPLAAWIARWETLDDDLNGLTEPDASEAASSRVGLRRIEIQRLTARGPDDPIPQPVGDWANATSRPRTTTGRLGQLALKITPSDADLLFHISRHPFLPIDGLAAVVGWTPARTRFRCKDLIGRGLVRLLDADEARGVTAELPELTADGLRLAAARLGFPLHRAVLAEGLVGGGPDEPIGRRHNLVRNLTHTLGADAIFIHLYRLAARNAAQGAVDEVVHWAGPAACRHGRVRPDGYGAYRRAGTRFHFFLEYDRGTSGVRALTRKLNRYYEYLETGRFRRHYSGFPDVLVVCTSNAAEARFARAARAASVGRFARLPLLLTTEWRIFGDPANPDGFLGRIWREGHEPFDRRRFWLEDTSPSVSRRP